MERCSPPRLTRRIDAGRVAAMATLAVRARQAEDSRSVARKAMRYPRGVVELLRGLESNQARVKYGSAKALRILSEKSPALVYPHFDFFVRRRAKPTR